MDRRMYLVRVSVNVIGKWLSAFEEKSLHSCSLFYYQSFPVIPNPLEWCREVSSKLPNLPCGAMKRSPLISASSEHHESRHSSPSADVR